MVCLWYAVLTIFLLKLHHYNVNTGVSTKFSYGCSSLYYFSFNKKIIRIMKYSGTYLQRRIPHASHGSFNPYIITNKEAHIVNGNISVGYIKKNEATSSNQQLQETNNNRRHFMNYCLTHSGRFSCAVDSFLNSLLLFLEILCNVLNVMSFFKRYLKHVCIYKVVMGRRI